MEIKCFFIPVEIPPDFNLSQYTVVVIDVLRATSVMAAAMYNGCIGVIPVASIEEALSIKNKIKNDVLLCGERDAVKIDGFDLGNSPQEFSKKVVSNKTIVHTTTNGTNAIKKVIDAEEVLTGSFLNLKSTVEYLKNKDKILLLGSGRLGEFSLEDTLCIGNIINELRKVIPIKEFDISDSSKTAEVLYERYRKKLTSVVLQSIHGKYLVSKGMKSDIRMCLNKNTHDCLIILDKKTGMLKKAK